MNDHHEIAFTPPSTSRFSLLIDTPFIDLVRGRITGRSNYRRLIAATNLTPELSHAVDRTVRRVAKSRRNRLRATYQLMEAIQEEITQGRAPERLAECLASAGDSSLRRYRLDSRIYLREPLPSSLWQVVHETVRQLPRRRWLRTATVDVMWQRLLAEHEAGVSVEEITSRFGEAAVNARLISECQSAKIVVLQSLPDAIRQVIGRTVRATRLWPREKRGVAQELCEHFRDGIDAEKSVDELCDQFGKSELVARLIRRAKIRCRPFTWHAWNRTWQLTVVSCIGLFLFWLWLFIPFAITKPSIRIDYIADMDDRNRAIPMPQRAWPVYRKGLEQLTDWPLDWKELQDVFSKYEQSEHWPAMVNYLDENAAAMNRFISATSIARLGFVDRDPENAEWLRANGHRSFDKFNELGTPVAETIH